MHTRAPATTVFLLTSIVATGAFASACAKDAPTGTIALNVGGEADAFTRTPAPTKITVDGIALDGTVSTLTTAAFPTTTIELGDFDTTRVAALRVTATDATGATLLRGLSLPIELGALEGASFPIFVQRVAEMARMPKPLADARVAPLVQTVADRYLVVAGGAGDTAKSGSLYDLALLEAYAFPTALSRAPQSIAVSGANVLLVDATGASSLDLSTFTEAQIAAPNGGTFAEIAGGATIAGDDDVTFIVGATRASGDATARILRIDSAGSLTFLTLAQPRLGASATWVKGRGLVVAGGAAVGAAVELLGPGATAPVPLAYPARDVQGSAAVVRDDGKLLVVGGVTTATGAGAPTELFDFGCTTACASTVLTTTLPATFVHTEAYAVSATGVLVIGSSADGASLAFRIEDTAGSVVPVPFKAPHTGAHSVRLYNGSVAVLGGATAIEAYAP